MKKRVKNTKKVEKQVKITRSTAERMVAAIEAYQVPARTDSYWKVARL